MSYMLDMTPTSLSPFSIRGQS